jgi:hypothetical protein
MGNFKYIPETRGVPMESALTPEQCTRMIYFFMVLFQEHTGAGWEDTAGI